MNELKEKDRPVAGFWMDVEKLVCVCVSSSEAACSRQVLKFGSLSFGKFEIYKQRCLIHSDHTHQ